MDHEALQVDQTAPCIKGKQDPFKLESLLGWALYLLDKACCRSWQSTLLLPQYIGTGQQSSCLDSPECMIQVAGMVDEPPAEPMETALPAIEPRKYSPAALRGICQGMQEAKAPSNYHELMWLQPSVEAQLSSFANQCLLRMLCASFAQPLTNIHGQSGASKSKESGWLRAQLEVLMWPASASASTFFATNLRRCLDNKLSLPPTLKPIAPTKMPNGTLRLFSMRAFNHLCSSEPPYEALQFLVSDGANQAAALAPPTEIPNHLFFALPEVIWDEVAEQLASLGSSGLMGAYVLAPAIHRFQLLSRNCVAPAKKAWAKLSVECGGFIKQCNGLESMLKRLNKPSVPSFHHLITRLDLPKEINTRSLPNAKPFLSELQLLLDHFPILCCQCGRLQSEHQICYPLQRAG